MLFYRILFFGILVASIASLVRGVSRYLSIGRDVADVTRLLPTRAPELWASIGKPRLRDGGSRLFGGRVKPFWRTMFWVLGEANSFQLPADVWEICARAKARWSSGHRWLIASFGVWMLGLLVVAVRVWMKYGVANRW